jgi:hypothetical protein
VRWSSPASRGEKGNYKSINIIKGMKGINKIESIVILLIQALKLQGGEREGTIQNK